MPGLANYTPLTPHSFLRRNARVYPDKTAIVHESARLTYAQFYERARRLASALVQAGIRPDDKVGILAPNTPVHLEGAFGIPMAGAVIVALNYRLSAKEIAFILKHSDTSLLLVDVEFLPLLQQVADELGDIRKFVIVPEPGLSASWRPPRSVDYEAFLAGGDPAFEALPPQDENQTIAINYTSGTTGNPKGVMYTHRSAYLNAACDMLEMNMAADSVYLWTLPMFHCNGWCYTWGVTAVGGTHVCLRRIGPQEVVSKILAHQVTHFCGAPIVLRMVADGAKALSLARFPHRVKVSTAAAPPSPAVIEAMLNLNVDVLHVYGLTETYGPTTVCAV
ncbi:MAG TPA: AMP-binding protein, partial [bacterium]|nr:AMP-binding protein [bacterium]